MKIIKLFVLCFFAFNCFSMDSIEEQIKKDFEEGKISIAERNMREYLVGVWRKLYRDPSLEIHKTAFFAIRPVFKSHQSLMPETRSNADGTLRIFPVEKID